MTIPNNLGMLSFAVGLIIWGLGHFVALAIPGAIVGLWAIITGLLLLVGR